jgi:DNA polymerase-3 subunit epsilon
MKEIVLDTETTGLSVKDGHRIVEIGCIELDNLIPNANKFHCYLNPERKVSEKALKVHGYTDQFLADKKKFIDIADEFLLFIKDKRLIIHNAEFDIGHLNNELQIAGKGKIDIKNVIDTLDIARDKFPGSQISLDALCKRYRIDNSKREKHTALLDCELLTKVYINLIDQKEPSLDFISGYQDNNDIKFKSTTNYSKKIIKPSDKEAALHKEFLKNFLKKNYFN